MATGNSSIDIEVRASSTFFTKVSSRKAFVPWLYAAFISALYEVGGSGVSESHMEVVNCKNRLV